MGISKEKIQTVIENCFNAERNIATIHDAFERGFRAGMQEDVQPVVHGKWEEDHWCGEKARRCSVCHITQTVNVYKGKVMYQYCPYCGAKMDKRGGAGDEVN